MTIEIIFEYHSTSEDNEAGVASGWNDPPLSAKGREQAVELGERHRGEQIDAVFCSDLQRAVLTAEIAFGGVAPLHKDRRLREYDYGSMTGMPTETMHKERSVRVETPFPDGESLADVANRVSDFLADLGEDWDGKRIIVVGHGATRLALDHLLGGMTLEKAAAQPFEWKPIPPSWRYELSAPPEPPSRDER
jgi:broad specificity phosphatase PhoE